MGALSVTWDEHYRAPFQPLIPGVTFVDPTDLAAHRRRRHDRHRGGHRRADPGRRRRAADLAGDAADAIAAACRRTGALLIADEVQCGLGRTGRAFYSGALGLEPDLMALGKALGAGVPIGAAMFSDRVAAAAQPGDHGSTYGGNLLACRAALVFLDELIDGGLMQHVARIGALPGARAARDRRRASRRSRTSAAPA